MQPMSRLDALPGAVSRWVPAALHGPARRLWTPGISGRTGRNHIALTLDDGPDPVSTPRILDTLAELGVHATFFLVGEHAAAHLDLVHSMTRQGHELAVHGWTHDCVLRLAAPRLVEDLARSAELVELAGGGRAQWYRPPYGITTLASLHAARRAGLQPVLWTAWGRDWSRWVDHDGIVWRVERTLRPGGTVLLHDTDRYGSRGSWRRTERALRTLVGRWRDHGIEVGPLRDHGITETSAYWATKGVGGR